MNKHKMIDSYGHELWVVTERMRPDKQAAGWDECAPYGSWAQP